MSFITHLDDGGAAANMGDFLANKLLPFMRDEALWVDNRSPASLTLPEAEVFTHAGTLGTPAPPYFFARTTQDGATMFIGTATGIDTASAFYDQPGRPVQSPNFSTITTNFDIGQPFFEGYMRRSRIQVVNNTVTSGFAGHFLFTDGDGVGTPGTYVHAVIQVSANEFRHLWVGTMTKYGTFTGGEYLVGHYHRLSSTGTTANDAAEIDQPYDGEHIPPGQITGNRDLSLNQEDNIGRNAVFRAVGLVTGVEWFHCHGFGGAPLSTTQQHGTYNTPIDVGAGAMVGYGDSFGAALWACEPNLAAKAKPLVPYTFLASVDFEAAYRWGAVGQLPDARRVNMRGLSAGEALTIGTDTWRVYPLVNSDASVGVGNPYTGYEGIAYRVA